MCVQPYSTFKQNNFVVLLTYIFFSFSFFSMQFLDFTSVADSQHYIVWIIKLKISKRKAKWQFFSSLQSTSINLLTEFSQALWDWKWEELFIFPHSTDKEWRTERLSKEKRWARLSGTKLYPFPLYYISSLVWLP